MSSFKIKRGDNLAPLLANPSLLVAFITFMNEAENKVFKSDDPIYMQLVEKGFLAVTEEGLGNYTLKSKSGYTIQEDKPKKKSLESREILSLEKSDFDKVEDYENFTNVKAFQVAFIQNKKNAGHKYGEIQRAKYGLWLKAFKGLFLDGWTIEEIQAVGKFLKGGGFWSSNVYSLPKLRKNFEKIYNNMITEQNKGGNNGNSKIQPEQADQLANYFIS